MVNNTGISKKKSDRIYSSFLRWREKLLELEEVVIVVEGKRDVDVLYEIGVKTTNKVNIIRYSQISLIEFADKMKTKFQQSKIIPLVDFDEKGEEYLHELKKFKYCDLELRYNLYSLTNGRLKEFEDLLNFLSKNLHPSYWMNLQEIMLNGTNFV